MGIPWDRIGKRGLRKLFFFQAWDRPGKRFTQGCACSQGAPSIRNPSALLRLPSDKTTVLKHIASSQPKWARKGLGRGGKSLGLDWEEVFLKVKILNMFAAPLATFS